ncbi:GNAT family N-acetyltransferase [Roseibium sp. FZY0029]|uniref:GNAT family N-acetyltransferase n=1 Tax=Roseibium sp. FZY0029 TaxID=3116647 RepID=UPI002EA2F5B8|nr:GNAT family N-acetyltransferase [Roseibium sp. FZY0029]
MDIRLWKPGDEAAILGLFNEVFGRSMSPEFWRWRFQNNPNGGPHIALAWDGERLAAHYAVTPAPIVVDGQTIPAALSTTTMTHADYRGQRLLEKVGGALYEELKSEGVVAVWGFPNAQAHLPRLQRLAWFDVCDVPVMSCLLDGTRRHKAHESSLESVDETDNRFAAIWQDAECSTAIHPSRSLNLMRWRLDQNPKNKYFRYIQGDEQSLSAYLIYKKYFETEVDIVDFHARDPDCGKSLLQGVLSILTAQSVKKVNAWCLPHDPHRRTFERLGFCADAPVTYFGGRQLLPIGKEFSDPRGWRLSMMDSDIY